MVLYVCLGIAALVGLVLLLLPEGGKVRFSSEKLWAVLGVVGLISAASLVVTLLIAAQGNPYAEKELISSQRIQDVGYSESSTRRGLLIGNYTYNVAHTDESGNTFLSSDDVRADSTALYIEEDLKDARLEQYQGYWFDPGIFPWRIWSYQSYRIYTPEDPR